MPKYLTRDQHIKFKGELIAPGTLVAVDKEDVGTWDELVRLKVATKVGRKSQPKETPEEESPEQEAPEEESPDDTSPTS